MHQKKYSKKKNKRPFPEVVRRASDGKYIQWEWKYDTELGIVHPSAAKRWEYLHERGRWVVTKVMDEK